MLSKIESAKSTENKYTTSTEILVNFTDSKESGRMKNVRFNDFRIQ